MIADQLGFGTASIHRVFGKSAQLKLLAHAYDLGIRYFDTARLYGSGIALNTLNEFCCDVGRHNVLIASKIGIRPRYGNIKSSYRFALSHGLEVLSSVVLNGSKKADYFDWSITHLQKELDLTLELGAFGYLDKLYLHEPNHIGLPAEVLAKWVHTVKSKGKIKSFGIAGEFSTVSEDVRRYSAFIDDLQFEDSLYNPLKLNGDISEKLTSSYGYIRNARSYSPSISALEVMQAVLRRHPDRRILFSTTSHTNLEAIVQSATDVIHDL
jgi:aryl-alcohol dehydrogenase-like predicted oxidoreductase